HGTAARDLRQETRAAAASRPLEEMDERPRAGRELVRGAVDGVDVLPRVVPLHRPDVQVHAVGLVDVQVVYDRDPVPKAYVEDDEAGAPERHPDAHLLALRLEA